jgi:hypothetical protein
MKYENNENNSGNMSRIFNSEFFEKYIKPKRNKNEKLLKEIEDIFTCYICLDYLENPIWDPSSCGHYQCKKCLNSYFNKMKTNIVPCPLCRNKIRKNNLKEIPLIKKVNEILKNINNYAEEEINEECSNHPKNKVFYICLDCSIKMCPACDIEKRKHETHHMVNYERYVKLFYCFHNNFAEIKEKIKKIKNNVKKYNNLYAFLEQQKKSYLGLLTNIAKKIENIFSTNQDNLTKLISNSFDNISKLQKFMNDLKKDVSSRFKICYNDIENFDEIEEEIKEKVKDIKLQFSKIDVSNVKNLGLKKLDTSKIEFSLTFNKNDILLNEQKIFKKKLDPQGIYTFGAELSEDNKFILFYFDVENRINNLKNESAYSPYLEYESEKNNIYYNIYLEEQKFDDQHYSYEKFMPIEEFFQGNEDKKDIKIKVNYISII